jgi:hypothetical protein
VWSLVWNMMLAVIRVSTTGRAHPPAASEQPTLRTTATLQGVPPSCCGRRVAVRSGACSSRPSTGAGKRTTCKQPANLGFESAEDFLSTLPDYTATVRPPPKRC